MRLKYTSVYTSYRVLAIGVDDRTLVAEGSDMLILLKL
jgi:hypothetical protein